MMPMGRLEMKNEANRLCGASLACMFVLPLLVFIVMAGAMSGDISGATADAYGIIIPVNFCLRVTAWVLAILARKRYGTRFSKVLIILYSVLLVLFILAAILLLGTIAGWF